ncbi:hypothetical protein ACHAWF_007654 [Thalassiosira exigua]
MSTQNKMSPTPKKIRCQSPDVVVAVGRGESMQEFECYKVVLSFASPYFNTMLGANMAEAHSNRIEFPDRDPEEWKLLYNFIDPSMIGEAKHRDTPIDSDIAMKLTPWFHEFQMESFLEKCDNVLNNKATDLFQSITDDINNLEANFDSLIQLLQFACLYDLEQTKHIAELFLVAFVDKDILEETIDLFTAENVEKLVELALPIEVHEVNNEKKFVARGKATHFWGIFIAKGPGLPCLIALEKNLSREVLAPLVFSLLHCEAEKAKSKKMQKALDEKVAELERVKQDLGRKKGELRRVRKKRN